MQQGRTRAASATGRRPLLALAAAALACRGLWSSAPRAGGAEEADVRAAFEGYRAALVGGDGSAAARLVTADSRAYHERLRDLALRAPAATVKGLPLADRLAVLRLRHEFTAAELAPLAGGELIALSVEESWGGPRTLESLRVVAVESDGAVAKAMVAAGAGGPPLAYRFRREAGGWRLDLAALARDAEPALAQSLGTLARRAGVDGDRALVLAVESSSGHLVDRDLWLPLQP